VTGATGVELLESLGQVINETIQSVSSEIKERKQAQQVARESEEEFKALFEATAEGILVADLETKELKYANPAICNMLGYSGDELIQMRVFDIHPKEQLENVVSIFEAQGRGEIGLSPDLPCLRKDGTTIFVDVNTAKVTRNGRDCNVGFFTDTTERKTAEERLKHLNAVLQATGRINHLITREASRDRLLEGACESLIKTVGYHNAWIALIDESGKVSATAHAGFHGGFGPMADCLKQGHIPSCARRALQTSRTLIIEKPAAQCVDCPLANAYDGRAALSACLEYQNKIYGWISVSIPRDFVKSAEVMELFEQVTKDIAFGLYRMELEAERKSSERALQEAYDIIKKSASVAFTWKNEEGWPVEFVSENVEGLFGYGADAFIHGEVSYIDCIHPEDLQRVSDEVAEHSNQQETSEFIHKPYRIMAKDGSEKIVSDWTFVVRDDHGCITHYKGILEDITEQKRAEDALRKSEEKYRTIFELSPEAILLLDSRGTILETNARMEDWLGCDLDEILGKDLTELPYLLEESKALVRKKFSERMNGKDVPPYEVESVSKTGKCLTGRVIGTAIEDGHSGTMQDLVMISDVTESKKAQEGLLLAKQEAEAANVAKSEFLANMSHEIRTPMNAVIGMTDLALNTQLTTEQREYLKIVKDSGDSLLTLINDILDLSKIESRKLKLDHVDFNLQDTVGDTLKALAVRADERGLELACGISPDVPGLLHGDPGRLRQIMMNLVGNAIKFTERGEVVVRVERRPDRNGKICLHFAVTDTGIGIPAEKQQEIFEPFSQADGSTTRKYGGTGLGLTITKHVVEMMGGEIEVESQVGKGTKMAFSVDFDLPRRPYRGPADLEPFDVKGLRVLVVDDNATNRRILEEILTTWGMKPTGAGNARVALANMEQAKAFDLPYSLVLLDAVMPGMDGFALAEEVKKRPGLVDAVIMMVTSAGQRGDAARCRELGISAYLTKPIKQSDLLDTIMAVLAYKQKHGERPPLITRHTFREQQGTHPEKADRPLKILVAEDNAVNQKVVSRLLEKQGHSVMLTKNGKEAVAAWEEEAFDLVLMDVQMPEMDGFQATRRIRERERRQSEAPIPIIALTAHAMKGDRERCLEAGMDAYVSKPIRAGDLFAEMERLTDRASEESKGASLASEDRKKTPDDVFDLPKALGLVGGDRVLLKELADIFVEDIPDSVMQIREGITRGEARTVELVAHRLKGSVANLAAKRAFEAAYGLELMGKEAALADAEGAVSRLETELEALKSTMEGALA
jgi:PAS domain S-box-containing protein